MKRKATYNLRVTRRESLHVHDEYDHQLMLVEMEGRPLNYEVGVAGEFVSRRSVNYHDRIGGSGYMQGYAVTNFQYGSVYSKFKGHRDGESKLTTGTWETYKGIGKLDNIKGKGTFKVTSGDVRGEFILEMEGDYDL
ncbi:MAG: hypothetical protein MUO88_16790 [Desulfobacterales bacterium]|nr:hypothetical protein [Desulfobacterales bacterium]